jgi:hypothetical protein
MLAPPLVPPVVQYHLAAPRIPDTMQTQSGDAYRTYPPAMVTCCLPRRPDHTLVDMARFSCTIAARTLALASAQSDMPFSLN